MAINDDEVLRSDGEDVCYPPVINDGAGQKEVSGPQQSCFIDPAYFRVLTYYQPGTDSIVARFDVRHGKMQANGALYGWFKSADPSTPMTRTGPLLMPTKGVEGGYTITADRKTLAAILRGLADKLDG